jgi:hypothetical protein
MGNKSRPQRRRRSSKSQNLINATRKPHTLQQVADTSHHARGLESHWQKRDKILFFFAMFLVPANLAAGLMMILFTNSLIIQAGVASLLARVTLKTLDYLFPSPKKAISIGSMVNALRSFRRKPPRNLP